MGADSIKPSLVANKALLVGPLRDLLGPVVARFARLLEQDLDRLLVRRLAHHLLEARADGRREIARHAHLVRVRVRVRVRVWVRVRVTVRDTVRVRVKGKG